jgi:AmmeMemoRadiSam system protein B/AmmeMemoRadiSam system protein A
MKRIAAVCLAILVVGAGWACERLRGEATAQNAPLAKLPDATAKGDKSNKGDEPMAFRPNVAGQFYPGDAETLQRQVDGFLNDAKVPADLGDVFGVVAPHAGYVYSGPVAGYSFKAVQGKKYELVVVLGLSHRQPGSVAALDYDVYQTPLGPVTIDRKATAQLVDAGGDIFERSERLFRGEHSIEVQLPFIQRALPGTPVVMVVLGNQDRRIEGELAAALDKTFAGRNVLFVASSDMTHYRAYDDAKAADLQTLELLGRRDLDGFYRLADVHERLCGLAPVTTLFELYRRRGGAQARVLKYLNSGDTAGDKSRVVGYGSIALLAPAGAAAAKPKADTAAAGEKAADDHVSAADKKQLLKIARETLESYIRTGQKPKFKVDSPLLLAPGAAFVTLEKNPGKQLRGCIGHVIAQIPLWECVRDMAVAASTEDPRFPRVREQELKDIHIEISVLTPATPVKDVAEIVVGTHGLIIGRGWQRGLLLPQVPTEYGWSRDEFLDQTCRKAGLPAGCWREPGTKIEKFSAVVFGE